MAFRAIFGIADRSESKGLEPGALHRGHILLHAESSNGTTLLCCSSITGRGCGSERAVRRIAARLSAVEAVSALDRKRGVEKARWLGTRAAARNTSEVEMVRSLASSFGVGHQNP